MINILNMINKFMESKGYFVFTVLVVMPINGYLMSKIFWLGLLLLVFQIPYIISMVNLFYENLRREG